MKLLFSYIREYRKTAVFFLLFTLVFFVIFKIYDVDTEVVVYSFLACAVIGVIAVIVGFLRYRHKHRLLMDIYFNLPLMTDQLPEPDCLTEESMQLIVRRIGEINTANINRLKEIQQDNSVYFTVWVHQIKTPISAMRMILQSEDSQLSRDLSAELFRIEQYAEMTLQYIRLDSSSNDLVIREQAIDGIIRQAVRRYAPLFIRGRIRLDYEPVEDTVLTDEKWMTFVVEQLLSNAVKYTAKGSVTISFRDGVLSVSDTGIGISADDLPRIFDKGYTGMSGRTDNKSTGLGLYLCKRACEMLGHSISAGSEVGVGSVFTVDMKKTELDIE